MFGLTLILLFIIFSYEKNRSSNLLAFTGRWFIKVDRSIRLNSFRAKKYINKTIQMLCFLIGADYYLVFSYDLLGSESIKASIEKQFKSFSRNEVTFLFNS